jgi:hypothetical protein
VEQRLLAERVRGGAGVRGVAGPGGEACGASNASGTSGNGPSGLGEQVMAPPEMVRHSEGQTGRCEGLVVQSARRVVVVVVVVRGRGGQGAGLCGGYRGVGMVSDGRSAEAAGAPPEIGRWGVWSAPFASDGVSSSRLEGLWVAGSGRRGAVAGGEILRVVVVALGDGVVASWPCVQGAASRR